MGFFKYHVFFCVNERGSDQVCCAHGNAALLQNYAKKLIKSMNLAGPGLIRINRSGCLGRCNEGPILVIYPGETWYTYRTESDIDEIVIEHLVNGRTVARLKVNSRNA